MLLFASFPSVNLGTVFAAPFAPFKAPFSFLVAYMEKGFLREFLLSDSIIAHLRRMSSFIFG
jgi:hypothetical protein